MVLCVNFENALLQVLLLAVDDRVQAQPAFAIDVELGRRVLVIGFVQGFLIENSETQDLVLDIVF